MNNSNTTHNESFQLIPLPFTDRDQHLTNLVISSSALEPSDHSSRGGSESPQREQSPPPPPSHTIPAEIPPARMPPVAEARHSMEIREAGFGDAARVPHHITPPTPTREEELMAGHQRTSSIPSNYSGEPISQYPFI